MDLLYQHQQQQQQQLHQQLQGLGLNRQQGGYAQPLTHPQHHLRGGEGASSGTGDLLRLLQQTGPG